MVGHTVFFNRLAYLWDKPQRYDVVFFYSREYDEYFGKRILGVPGDHISFEGGRVRINSVYIDESEYIESNIRTDCYYEFDVPADSYFMLGDNREYSCDSRHWQESYISGNDIAGKYIGQINFSMPILFR